MNLKELLGDVYKEGMTFEEVEKALEGIELPKETVVDNTELTKLKNMLNKASSEAADYKKQLRQKLTDEEAKAAADKEERERILNENQELHKKIAISENISALVGLGYDTELATQTAEAMFNGDMKTVITNQKSFLELREKEIRADEMYNTPKPVGGQSGKTPMTREDIMKITDTEARQQAIAENPDLFGL